MGKFAPKAKDNPLYLARLNASNGNDAFGSRESAAKQLCINPERLRNIELDLVIPRADEIMIMADAYNAPELMNYHCAVSCPIGRKTVPRAEIISLDRLIINTINALDGIEDKGKKLCRLCGGGDISAEILPVLRDVMTSFNKVAQVRAEMQIWLEKRP